MHSPAPRYLTKSRFKLGMECPAKLFYTGKDAGRNRIYANRKLEDDFLAALAEGGFQVGELAKQYFPGGKDIKSLDSEEALAQTNMLLEQRNAVIYEAAVRFENLFIRADILVKTGDAIDLIEVKAKSWAEDDSFIGKRGGIDAGWKPYLEDVAFQKHVVTQAFPGFKVRAFLMLADKCAECPTDGLHQKFLVAKKSAPAAAARRRIEVVVKPLNEEERAQRILCQVNVDRECEAIYAKALKEAEGPAGFAERIAWMAAHYERDEKILCRPTTACAGCEFRATAEEEANGLKSGFKECWKQTLKWSDRDFEKPNVLNIWDYRRKSKLLAENRAAMSEVTKGDIGPKADGKPGLSSSERQWLQVEKAQAGDPTHWMDRDGLRREMAKWKFPLHFIDFETTRVAIPFNRGRHPYELVAFQYSHHVVREDGGVEHKGQYLNAERGVFPNYEFVRRLKEELEGDEGSVFRYADHENTTLAEIDRQLAKDPDPPSDQKALRRFIRTITTSPKHSADHWSGSRKMIDLCELVKRYHYAPATNGSNSIKHVLPAVLDSSAFLKEKYAPPVYGVKHGIPSLNFQGKKWIQMEGGKVVDPYKLLPRMFADVSDHDMTQLNEGDELKNGGAAMTAYARMQFEEMGEREREEIRAALLRYCELDTLAMVMLYEAWRAEIV
jgi:hypothetical protein